MTEEPRVVFIHGIGGKPLREHYLKQWIDAVELGVDFDPPDDAFSMAYWADRRGEVAAPDVERELVTKLSPDQRRFLVRYGSAKARHLTPWDRALSWFFKLGDRVFRDLLDRYIDDVYNYFYRGNRRDEIRALLRQELRGAQEGDQTALVSHSLGTVIAMDVLKDWTHPVELFVTMGSPLGFEWIRDKLGHPTFPACVGRWVNVYDRADPVSLADPKLNDDYGSNGKRVEDHLIRDNFSDKNKRDPHHWHGYLSCPEVAEAITSFWRG